MTQNTPATRTNDPARAFLISARRALGMTQSQIAKGLGTTRDQVASYESGRVKCPADVFPKVSVMLSDRAGQLLSCAKQINEMLEDALIRLAERSPEFGLKDE